MNDLPLPKIYIGNPKYRYHLYGETSDGYNAVHRWNLRNWQKQGICEFCRATSRTEWSNKSGEYRRGDDFDWQELCLPCHKSYDAQVLGVKFGRKKVLQ